MRSVTDLFNPAQPVAGLVSNLIPLLTVVFRSRTSLIAENLFLRKQLAFYQEHKLKPQPLTDAARWTLVLCSRLFEWRSAELSPQTFCTFPREFS